MTEKGDWSRMVTRRASVMTPLIIVNALLLFFGTVIYIDKGSIILYVLWVFVAIYTFWKYEYFSQKSPWLLSSQKVALKGMELFGDSTKQLNPKDVIDMEPVSNPNSKAIDKPKREHK